MTTGANVRAFASPFIAPQLELDNDPVSYQVEVPAESTVTVWDEDAGGANPSAFDFLVLSSDLDVELEFTHEANAVTTHYSVFTLAGGGVPFVLASALSRAGTFSGDALANGTVGRITKIRAKNSSTDTTAYIAVVIGQ